MLVLRLSLLLFFWRVDTHEKDTLQAEMVIKQQEELEIKKKKSATAQDSLGSHKNHFSFLMHKERLF